VGSVVAAASVLWASWSAVTSEARPLWGDHSIVSTPWNDQMFRYLSADWVASYHAAVQVADHLDAKVIGTYHDLWYPLWVLLDAPASRTIVDLDAEDRAQYGAGPPPTPDIIICSRESYLFRARCDQGPGPGWTLYSEDKYLRVFLPDGVQP
jgi:hypothetical protein